MVTSSNDSELETRHMSFFFIKINEIKGKKSRGKKVVSEDFLLFSSGGGGMPCFVMTLALV